MPPLPPKIQTLDGFRVVYPPTPLSRGDIYGLVEQKQSLSSRDKK